MRHRVNKIRREGELHPQLSIGLFFVALGVALLVATNDWLKLGSVSEYFSWETALIFIGFLLILNLKLVGGLFMMSAGIWFFLDDRYGAMPELIKTIYWPAVIVAAGVIFIISSFFRRKIV